MKIGSEIGTEITPFLDTALDATWAAPGRLLVSILEKNGVDFGPPGAVGEFSKN